MYTQAKKLLNQKAVKPYSRTKTPSESYNAMYQGVSKSRTNDKVKRLVVFNGLLRQKDPFRVLPRKTGFERGANNIVEEESPINEQGEPGDLEPFECFPA